jgi:mono/diheme cytochrome c family protein
VSARLALLAAAALVAAPAATGGAASAQDAAAAAAADGQKLYARHCLSCHQADGYGVPNLQPPIAGGTWVKGDARALALFVMTGGFDSESRKQSENSNVMPPFAQLSDADLAALLTFIRAKFGGGASPVSEAEVAESRAKLPAVK